ncbi:hypothetical protein JG687_00000680 [Phytophthora cactorum]|uniref:Uncharacterized protein n=1 Tax=Phytophthora cactorum TaxID=29920 RepID=A0A8T1V0D2_9STRA|nr:hypothetical protein PC120_g1102 [Phytophthora cactorum]KAG3096509.1 hypothetical protein PC121_g2500 [Phytophthora cactorum]KAG4064517.1 hypothetical protein PC123_g757 [Phytophthora cactorum]KAG6973835.1 hypothetical protein JG687_00000680 [Phytophthora cactorum]
MAVPASSTGFSIRKYFRRPSQSSPSSGLVPQAGHKKESPELESQLRPSGGQKQQMQRSAVFESCAQAVGTVASVLFSVVNRCGHYDETARNSTVTRQAKILYVSLLENVQKERGEWQGFSSGPKDNNGPEDTEVLSPRDLLTSSINTNPTADQLGVLNELLEVSFRNLMGPLVPLELYTRQRKVLLRESLAVPPGLTTLMAIRGILDLLEREVRHCLLRLFALWDLIALVSGEAQPLLKTIADKHHHVFSESSEFESMTARKSERQDTVAINLLQVMVLYRDILFSDIEFILTKQELQINARLTDDIRAKAWPPESEPAALSEEENDRFSSDGDISSSYSDENQMLHDDADGMSWVQDPALDSFALRSRTSSSVPSVLEEEEQDGEYIDAEAEGGDWSIPSPPRYHEDRKTQRSRSMTSPPVSGGAGPLVPVPLIPSSSEGIPPPSKLDHPILEPRPIERIPSGLRHSQRSLTYSPTHSAISQASSSTRSSSRKTKLRSKQRSSSSINGSVKSYGQQYETHWQDTTSNESRSPPPLSRSTMRRSGSKRMRGIKHASARRRLQASAQSAGETKQNDTHRPAQDKVEAKPDATPSFLSIAASSLAIPVAAATLCVLATMATLAIYEMRRAPRH